MTVTLRRLLAVLLLVAPPLESGAALTLMSSSAHAGCTGHVCFCPPRPAAREACHGGEGRASDSLSGACHHDADASPVLPATTPFLLSAGPALAGTEEAGPAPLARARQAAPGHLRIPLLPPRTA